RSTRPLSPFASAHFVRGGQVWTNCHAIGTPRFGSRAKVPVTLTTWVAGVSPPTGRGCVGSLPSQADGMRASADRPGVVAVQQGFEVALALLLDRRRDLLGHQLVVDGLVDVSEDPERSDSEVLQLEAAESERETRLRVVLVVDEQCVLPHIRDVDDLHGTVP